MKESVDRVYAMLIGYIRTRLSAEWQTRLECVDRKSADVEMMGRLEASENTQNDGRATDDHDKQIAELVKGESPTNRYGVHPHGLRL